MIIKSGADMVFIGPNDLAASMGYFAADHAKIEEVQRATVRVLKAAKEAGIFAGHFALSADIGTCYNPDPWPSLKGFGTCATCTDRCYLPMQLRREQSKALSS